MKINGKDISKMFCRSIASIDTSIGKLFIFSLSARNQQEMMTDIGEPLQSCDSGVFAKQLIRYVCYPEDRLDEEKLRPDSPALAIDDIDSVSDEEVESIIGEYLDNSPSLLRKSKTVTDEDGLCVPRR